MINHVFYNFEYQHIELQPPEHENSISEYPPEEQRQASFIPFCRHFLSDFCFRKCRNFSTKPNTIPENSQHRKITGVRLFSDVFRWRLSSLLHLQQVPVITIDPGLRISDFVVENLNFDPSALSHLIEDGSSGLLFERVAGRKLSVRVTQWRIPAFNIEVSGIEVVLSLGEFGRNLRGGVVKSILSLLDPEGASLPQTLGLLLNKLRDWIACLTLKTILERSQLQVKDVSFGLQSPEE